MKNLFNLKSFNAFLSVCLVCLTVFLFFSACNKSSDAGPQQEHSNIVVINASEASGPQDVYINNYKIGTSSLGFGQIMGYIPVNPSLNLVEFKAPGTPSVISSVNVTASLNDYYSVFLGDNSISVALQDNRSQLPQTGKARIRFINLSSFLSSDADFGPTGGSKLISNLGVRTVTQYYEVDPTITSISTYAAGSSTATINTPVTLAAGRIYIDVTTGTTSTAFQGKLFTEL